MTPDERFDRAIAAIDRANAEDPNGLVVDGRERPKELAHAELATTWTTRLVEDPSDALLLAVRAHHLRRWTLPRSEYPAGRPGYLRWRKVLQQRHAEEVAGILESVGYPPRLVERVQAIIQKRDLGRDPEVQAFEDALCLVFLETQLAEFAADHPSEKAGNVLAKTFRKMSPAARTIAAALPLPDSARRLLEAAVARDTAKP